MIISQIMPQSRQTAVLSSKDKNKSKLPQTVVAYGHDLTEGETVPFHHHRWAQLVYASHGIMTVTTEKFSYVVPPQRAVWIPAGVEHSIDARSDVSMRPLYIDSCAADLPTKVCVLQITPLLRELILSAVASGSSYQPDSPQSRTISVILDQISMQTEASLALPMPTDSRLLRVTQSLITNPADSRNLGEWAWEVGASKRTLGRLFSAQTGMSFRAWRQQRRLHRALELLVSGDSVTTIALELGYNSTSAFIAMFKRNFGKTPKRYLSTTS